MEGFSKSGNGDDTTSSSDDDSDIDVDDDRHRDHGRAGQESLLSVVQEDTAGEIMAGDEILHNDNGLAHDDDEEALYVVDGPPLSTSHGGRRGSKIERMERRMSSPIGLRESIGPGGGRRLSNGLAASNMGQGTGGTTFS